MCNLDYELMLEECVEGTFFERGPSGIVKKDSEPTKNTTDENGERKKRQYEMVKKGLITGTFIVGGVAVTLASYKGIKYAKKSREDNLEKQIIDLAHEYNRAYTRGNDDEADVLWRKLMRSLDKYSNITFANDHETAFGKNMDMINRSHDIALGKH